MRIYDDPSQDFGIEKKADNSPLTLADKAAHNCIVRHLEPTGIPILSEEGAHLPYDERKAWHRLWIVDPLDGTKEFIKKNGEFTVNIALVEDGNPILGVIYVPATSTLYAGKVGEGAWKQVAPNSPPKLEGVPDRAGACVNRRSNNLSDLKSFRRELRSHGTPAEGALWNILKARQIGGLQFRRQFSIDNYILDFYCPAIRLAIELDGDYHYDADKHESDTCRNEELMRKYGIETMRIENKYVFTNPRGIENAILARAELINKHTPSPLRGTPPNLGGESSGAFTIVASRSHLTPETEDFIEQMKQEHEEVRLVSSGSSLKICLVAEGTADIYPRFAPTMEWDTAAGDAIARAAGREVVDAKTGKPLVYNKSDLHNPWFIVQ